MNRDNIPAWAGIRACALANEFMTGKERYDWREDMNIPSVIAFAAYIAENETPSGTHRPLPLAQALSRLARSLWDSRVMPQKADVNVLLNAYSEATLKTSPHGYAADPDECEECDNGRIWNNADPTSGQWVSCDCGEAA